MIEYKVSNTAICYDDCEEPVIIYAVTAYRTIKGTTRVMLKNVAT
ncbi:MAG: hypothetical protein ACNYVW_10010 [Methanosarcinales archaeon]